MIRSKVYSGEGEYNMEGKLRFVFLGSIGLVILGIATEMIALTIIGFLVVVLVIVERMTRNTGAGYAKHGVRTVKSILKKKAPEQLELLEGGNVLGIGYYRSTLIYNETLTGAMVVEREKMTVLAFKQRFISGKVEGMHIYPEDIDLSKSYYSSAKKWVVLYLKGSKYKYFIRNSKQTDEGVLEDFIEKNEIKIK